MKLNVINLSNYTQEDVFKYKDLNFLTDEILNEILSNPQEFQKNNLTREIMQWIDIANERAKRQRKNNPEAAKESLEQLTKDLKKDAKRAANRESNASDDDFEDDFDSNNNNGKYGQYSDAIESLEKQLSDISSGNETEMPDAALEIPANAAEQMASELDKIMAGEIYDRVVNNNIEDTESLQKVLEEVRKKYQRRIDNLKKLGEKLETLNQLVNDLDELNVGSYSVNIYQIAEAIKKKMADKIRRESYGAGKRVKRLDRRDTMSRLAISQTVFNAAVRNPENISIRGEDVVNYMLNNPMSHKILLDISGSMEYDVKLVAAKKCSLGLKQYFIEEGDDVKVIAFSGNLGVKEVDEKEIIFLESGGGTPLHDAVSYCLDIDKNINFHGRKKVMTIISDGAPDHQESTIDNLRKAVNEGYQAFYFYIEYEKDYYTSRYREQAKGLMKSVGFPLNFIEIPRNDLDRMGSIITGVIKNGNK